LRVIALYPDQKAYPEALYRAGLVFNSLGKFKKAEQLLNDLNDNYPDNAFAKEAEPIRQSVAAKAREAEAAETSGATKL
jgi:TolA-binding protein